MGKKRDKTLDSLKGITMIIVVLRHVLQGGASDSDTVLVGNMMLAVEMPLFIIISGYFGCKNFRNERYDARQLIEKLIKITFSYMIPFLSFFFIFKVVILRQYTGNIFNLISLLANDITISLWFLFVIWVLGIISTMSFFIVGFVSRKGNNEYLKLLVYISSYVVLIFPWVIFALKNSTTFLGAKYVLYYSIFYLMGYLTKCFRNEIGDFLNSLRIKEIFYAVSLFLFAYITCNVTLLYLIDNLWGTIIRFVVASSGIYVLVYLCYSYKEKINKTIFNYIGQYTLEIYFVHSLLVRIMNTDNDSPLFTIQGFLNSSILLLLLSVFTFFIIVLVKSSKIADFLIFGKNRYK
ncbi:MAG: acyltransferase family protein [Acetobacterium sp.]